MTAASPSPDSQNQSIGTLVRGQVRSASFPLSLSFALLNRGAFSLRSIQMHIVHHPANVFVLRIHRLSICNEPFSSSH
jgi:hypothetical protein